ncbi:ABC transporter ATP-binding protein [Aureimonas sp. AU12]|uniref:ABC transporter ATP-binding protein n=1 Tax=Aureimonas sp. AU12 TaxID=1638161 RepID=UPI0007808D17|nr:ABC transporter ATP-binding protein [Aureimonas sp. AU12]
MSLVLEGYGVAIGRREIVRDVSVSAAPGEILAVLGPNGAGKSTFMKGLCGLRPATGRLHLGGIDLARASLAQRARLVGYVAQDVTHLNVQLSVFELMLLAQNGGRRSWRTQAHSLAQAEEILETLKLTRFARARPATLSGGERQMIALALALVRRPRLLLLDEPTSALDLANQLQMLAAVADYTRRHEVVTLTILHDLNLATRYAASTLLLAGGRVQGAGATRSVLTPETLRAVYGVDCHLIDIPDTGFTAIYPLSVGGIGA